MTTVRLLLITVALSLLTVTAKGEHEEFETQISRAGKSIGRNFYLLNRNGNFESRSVIRDTDGKERTEIIRGKFSFGVFKDVSFETTIKNPSSSKTSSKLTPVGEKSQYPNRDGDCGFVAQFHPQILKSLLTKFEWEVGRSKNVEALDLDTGKKCLVKISAKRVKAVVYEFFILNYRIFQIEKDGETIQLAQSNYGGIDQVVQSATEMEIKSRISMELIKNPVSTYPELSQEMFEVDTPQAVAVPMKNGRLCKVWVVLPKSTGKFPTIVRQVANEPAVASSEAVFFASRGYAYVAQDIRSSGEAGADLGFFSSEPRDLKSILDWTQKNGWSDGNIGLIGCIDQGFLRDNLTRSEASGVRCIVNVPGSNYLEGYASPRTSHPFPLFEWLFIFRQTTRSPKVMEKSESKIVFQVAPALKTLPLSKTDEAVIGYNVPAFDKLLLPTEKGGLVGSLGYEALSKLNLPILHFDFNSPLEILKPSIAPLLDANNRSQWIFTGDAELIYAQFLKSSQRAISGTTVIPEFNLDILRWFDTWLKKKPVSLSTSKHVNLYVSGANRWTSISETPSKENTREFFFDFSTQPEKTRVGGLTSQNPLQTGRASWVFDPKAVSVSLFYRDLWGYRNPRPAVEKLSKGRPDALILISTPFGRATALGGPMKVEFDFQTSAKDTDVFVSLIDVAPNGSYKKFGETGYASASQVARKNGDAGVSRQKTYRVALDLSRTAHEFKKGSRLGVLIVSEMFPAYARNLGTGEPIKSATKIVIQRNTILSSPKTPAKLTATVLWEK